MTGAAAALVGLVGLVGQPAEAGAPLLTIVATTDVHGNFFPYDFINRQNWSGSMARVATYVDSLRRDVGADRLLLLDNGDILQGQPAVYYYNFVDTAAEHIAARIYRFVGYDAATIGNHDVETGHAVYDRWIEECAPMPVLGANVVRADSGEPYLRPYTVVERGGLRVAILGLLTPAIPAWLPENLWAGLRFDDMKESAEKWVRIIREREDPDLLIGLFHSGADPSNNATGFNENASVEVAREVDGFDAVIFGHDHRLYNSTIINDAGNPVVLLNPANNARSVARIDITTTGSGPEEELHLRGDIVSVAHLKPSPAFLEHFAADSAAISRFVGRRLGESTGVFTTRDAFFGPSAFIDLLHRLQLDISGAEISLAAPLSFDARIGRGDLTVSDMFSLYKYENTLCVVEMTGDEIKRYLEKSYGGWIRQMGGPDEEMLLFGDSSKEGTGLANPCYNFDSAAGIDYTVDLRRPEGEKITITGMSDGRPFSPDSVYRVAVNSYRANGGGNLMTDGAGIPREQLKERIVSATDRDLRYYLIRQIEQTGRIEPVILGNWHFIPQTYVDAAAPRDHRRLFGQ
ncbi:MAG: 5'-nucleotidase C-terminal domain-containing protein [Clostridium sp.]|nr:5'-nucleotidase C-terminal domain-containing protein [Clostridium sp.]